MARRTRKRRQNRRTDCDAPLLAESDFDEVVEGETESKSTESIDTSGGLVRPPTEARNPTADEHLRDRALTEAVESNTELLQQLLDQVAGLREVVVPADAVTHSAGSSVAAEAELDEECERLGRQIADLEYEVSELRQQNSDLASQVASSNVQRTVSHASGGNDAMSWEERKQLILQQMEQDTFDADAFASSLDTEASEVSQDPSEFVRQLSSELQSRDVELAKRDEELRELRHLLDQQSGAREGGIAVGAAAIAEMIDADELVQQERERLQLLQEEWEEKFRQGEIEASLERAKLSRERQELAQKQAELEEQLEHIRRETRDHQESGSSSRRWLVKLGLADNKG